MKSADIQVSKRIIVGLRPFMKDWLSSIGIALDMDGADSLLVPRGFPHAAFKLRKVFTVQLKGSSGPAAYTVTFEHGPRSETGSVFWRIRSGPVDLAQFEITTEIYDRPQGLPINIDATLVLSALDASLDRRRTVGLIATTEQEGPDLLEKLSLVTLPKEEEVRVVFRHFLNPPAGASSWEGNALGLSL